MAFADAVFEGQAALEGLDAVRLSDPQGVTKALSAHEAVVVYTGDLRSVLMRVRPFVLVDARMWKHAAPDPQGGLAPLTIGLGPDLVAGHHADVVVETSWDGLGGVITQGASKPLAGEPREIAGHARDRYIYAPCEGIFRTKAHIGDAVRKGQEIAEIGSVILTAPLDGLLRGLTHDGVPVTARTKVIEVDPRNREAEVRGIAERPRRIAEGVLSALRTRVT
jgi:xanthine dehydrogenase accessory factor